MSETLELDPWRTGSSAHQRASGHIPEICIGVNEQLRLFEQRRPDEKAPSEEKVIILYLKNY